MPDVTPGLIGARMKAEDEDEIQRKMDEISRQIEMQKKEIAMLAVREDSYPASRTDPSISQLASDVDAGDTNVIPGLGDIPIPTNLVDILKSIKGPTDTVVASGSTSSTNYGVPPGIGDEYTPTHSATTIYSPVVDYIPTTTANTPGKLAQMTDEELLRMVPDDSLISQPPPAKKGKFDIQPLPPGIEQEEYVP